jgi:hypothetical protein
VRRGREGRGRRMRQSETYLGFARLGHGAPGGRSGVGTARVGVGKAGGLRGGDFPAHEVGGVRVNRGGGATVLASSKRGERVGVGSTASDGSRGHGTSRNGRERRRRRRTRGHSRGSGGRLGSATTASPGGRTLVGLGGIKGDGITSGLEGLAGGHVVVGAADRAFELGNEGLGLVAREPFLANPVEVDFGFASLADDVGCGGAGAGGASNATVFAEVAVVEKSGEAQDQGVKIEGFEIPLIGLSHADTVVHRGECRVVRTQADALCKTHFEGEVREDEATGFQLLGKAGKAMGQSGDGLARLMLEGAPVGEVLPQPPGTGGIVEGDQVMPQFNAVVGLKVVMARATK